jgi:pimeloyl-ACP methyl ester carboxylesterase
MTRSSSVIGLPSSVSAIAVGLSVAAIGGAVFLLYLLIKYGPVVSRHFLMQPLFAPLRLPPVDADEHVEFTTDDGLRVSGSLLRARTREQAGLIVYCHEYHGDRWSVHPYVDHLRDVGFDLFAFDFRNHGASDREPGYDPMQWSSDREVCDLRSALKYLRTRPDHDPAGFGLFGVSRGGTTALLAAAEEPDVWGIITDGAFPTRGTMFAYIVRWAEIYVTNRHVRALIPHWFYRILAASAERRAERRLNCTFPSAEAAVARLSPRPWLMIHGARDEYIGPAIARRLFACGGNSNELWLVPDARHNRCREANPLAHAARVVKFLERVAPRRPAPAVVPAATAQAGLAGEFAPALASAALPREAASSISR